MRQPGAGMWERRLEQGMPGGGVAMRAQHILGDMNSPRVVMTTSVVLWPEVMSA